jgi:hypothetical protein
MWFVMDLASASLPVANPEGPRSAASLAASRRDPRISRPPARKGAPPPDQQAVDCRNRRSCARTPQGPLRRCLGRRFKQVPAQLEGRPRWATPARPRLARRPGRGAVGPLPAAQVKGQAPRALCQLGARLQRQPVPPGECGVRRSSGGANTRRALAQDDRLIRAKALAGWAEPPQAPMAAPRRRARRQAYWPGARMLRSVREHV